MVDSTSQTKLLIIGAVWPEPTSSAGGTRTMELIQLFQHEGWQITFASSAAFSEHAVDLSELNIKTQKIELNSSSFDDFIKELSPDIVLFDKFMTEEQFGWRVDQHCPEALKILDTIDLHCLRKARHQALKENRNLEKNDLFSETAVREVAAIYRSDLSLMISKKEIEVLEKDFSVSEQLVHYLPFLLKQLTEQDSQQWPSFEERQHFMTIGNFLHDPNWDAVLHLKQTLWPPIRKALPQAELHIYGSYVPQKALQLHNPKEGFLVLGRADSVEDVMQKAKVCLAPLRFGAGMKGKLIDAMCNGTPSVTTSIGAESMYSTQNNDLLPWAGSIQDNDEDFIKAAVDLYANEQQWHTAQQKGVAIINQCFDKKVQSPPLVEKINSIQENLKEHRLQNFTGTMLKHHTMKSTYFMSKWIESKNS